MGKEARREGAKLNVAKMRQIAGEDAVVFFSGDMNVALGSPEEAEGSFRLSGKTYVEQGQFQKPIRI